MRPELLIRPGLQDHKAIANLLAPGGPGRRPGRPPIIDRLVLDAAVAANQPAFAEVAGATGVPVIVDPMTYLTQDEQAEDQAWARLPIGVPSAMTANQVLAAIRGGTYVEQVVQFQIDQRATMIVPPYFHAASVEDPWFEATLSAMFETHRAMERMSIRLPLLPVLSARLDRFGKDKTWGDGLDRFVESAELYGARTIATQLGPAGQPNDHYARVLDLFTSMMHLQRPHLRVWAFRQGTYGPALTAVGASGFETGISYGDSTNIASLLNNRRPKKHGGEGDEDGSAGGGAGRVFVPALGRFVDGKGFAALNANLSTRALLTCDDPIECCDSIDATLKDRRAHAVRSRARALERLQTVPPGWRLGRIELSARQTIGSVQAANRVLEGVDIHPLRHDGLDSLRQVAQYLGHQDHAAA